MTETPLGRAEFWKSFYSERARGRRFMPPSQFAAFVSQEIEPDCMIADLGCGNGRDAIFFAAQGITTVGVDAAAEGISVAQSTASELGLDNVRFVAGKVNDAQVEDILQHRENSVVCAYARFFLHAITEDEQASFFALLARNLRANDMIAVEYRTLEDKAVQKDALPHFRRYQSSKAVDEELQALGFSKVYGAEGRGFAKFKSEDAIVARGLYKR